LFCHEVVIVLLEDFFLWLAARCLRGRFAGWRGRDDGLAKPGKCET
jgi:hypothetical protein